jgi:hypothetical protein
MLYLSIFLINKVWASLWFQNILYSLPPKKYLCPAFLCSRFFIEFFYVKGCTNNKFGLNCSETCRCKGEHSANIIQSCDTATGKCMCQSHWQGDTCNDDVDECEGKSACKDKDNTVCINYDGGYSCKCEHGYKEYPGILCIKGIYIYKIYI